MLNDQLVKPKEDNVDFKHLLSQFAHLDPYTAQASGGYNPEPAGYSSQMHHADPASTSQRASLTEYSCNTANSVNPSSLLKSGYNISTQVDVVNKFYGLIDL